MTTAARTKQFSEGRLAQVKGVEIFQSGLRRGDEYTDQDLREMVANHRRHSSGPRPLVSNPVVIGHEEEQPLAEGQGTVPELENTGTPKLGRVSKVYAEIGPCPVCHGKGNVDGETCPNCAGKKQVTTLKGDFSEVPHTIAKLINARAYDHVSAEVYDEPPEGVPGKGKMLRRVALLGGDLPQIKTLADLPLAEYSEQTVPRRLTRLNYSGRRQVGAGICKVFSEVVPMDRSQLEQQALALGISQGTIDQITDDAALGALVMDLLAAKSGTPTPDATTPETPPEGQMSDDPTKKAVPCSEGIPTPAAPAPAPTAAAASAGIGAGQPSQVVIKYVEKLIGDAFGRMENKFGTKVAQLDKFAEDRLAAEKKSLINAELTALVAAGKVLPAELDAGLADVLFETDSRTVKTFSENGKPVKQTALDRQLGSLKARPVLASFAERVKGGKVPAGGTDEVEVEKVRQHANQPAFAHALKAAGRTPEQHVARFSEARKKNPALTAKQFGAPEAV